MRLAVRKSRLMMKGRMSSAERDYQCRGNGGAPVRNTGAEQIPAAGVRPSVKLNRIYAYMNKHLNALSLYGICVARIINVSYFSVNR